MTPEIILKITKISCQLQKNDSVYLFGHHNFLHEINKGLHGMQPYRSVARTPTNI